MNVARFTAKKYGYRVAFLAITDGQVQVRGNTDIWLSDELKVPSGLEHLIQIIRDNRLTSNGTCWEEFKQLQGAAIREIRILSHNFIGREF